MTAQLLAKPQTLAERYDIPKQRINQLVQQGILPKPKLRGLYHLPQCDEAIHKLYGYIPPEMKTKKNKDEEAFDDYFGKDE